MEAKPTTAPRSIPRQRRLTITAVARGINTGVIITRRRVITRQHRVTTQRRVITSRLRVTISLDRATTRQGPGPVTGLIRIRAGEIVAAMADTGVVLITDGAPITDVVPIMAVVAAAIADRP